ncbi:hypothetical protein MMC17_009703 [Xylographa soralifera]|nr:hypothetical protein [Xylographa soralifera]
MDFWSRLIGGAASTPKKQSIHKTPQQRLAQFKSTYNALLRIWHNGDSVSTDVFVAENVRICLRRLSELLQDDSRGPTPHLCVSFAATSRLLVIVCRVGSTFKDDGITHEALGICSLLIDSEEEAFLEDRSFANILPQFVNSVMRAALAAVDVEIENAMLEVLFGIASRIRLQPEVLSIWFRPSAHRHGNFQDDRINETSVSTRNEDFPLFYLLLQYVPAEGRAGEFARMGLLYLIESAVHSEALERWIVEGDMASFMASGLGALYSQLSRKLSLSYFQDEIPTVLSLADRVESGTVAGAAETTSPEYQAYLATFLASLVFWQDLLEHCTSIDVKQTLLDHFQFLFLQQLLYPSLLESSDSDGGSSVAVLTYLCHILESIDHPDLTRLILQYLFGIHDASLDLESPARPTALARRRKSEGLIFRLANGGDNPSPDLFNLADLILGSLESKNQQTLTATLRLLSVILRKHHPQALVLLLRTRPNRDQDKRRTVDSHERQIDNLLSMAESIAEVQSGEGSYERYLQDSRIRLESHLCTARLWSHPDMDDVRPAVRTIETELAMKKHTLVEEDPILYHLLDLMENFYLNDVETNLGLTEVLIDLASCVYTRIEGWFLTDPAQYRSSDDAQVKEEIAASIGQKRESIRLLPGQSLLGEPSLPRPEPSWQTKDMSPVFSTIHKLVQKAESFYEEIQDFGACLLECRVMVGADEGARWVLPNTIGLHRTSQDISDMSPNRTRNKGQIESISERLRSERLSGSDSRNSSPRGRQLDHSSNPTLVGRLSYLYVSPSRTSSQSSSRAYSPSPLRNQSIPSTPPKPNTLAPRPSSALFRTVQIVGRADNIRPHIRELSSSEASSVRSESVEPDSGGIATREVTLGHLLTNIVILQEFILELAALIEIRAGMFEEVEFI